MTAKIEWYREVLELEPNSKVFLPLARLLAEDGQGDEAIRILEEGVKRHPEFLEARLCLIEMLHRDNCTEQCNDQIGHLSKLFASYAGFWEAWAACLASDQGNEDTASIIRFLAAHFVSGPIKLHDVLNRGLDAMLRDGSATPCQAAQIARAAGGNAAREAFAANTADMLADLDAELGDMSTPEEAVSAEDEASPEEPELPVEEIAPDTAEMAEAADAVMPEPEEAALPAEDEALPPEPEAVVAAPEEPELPVEEIAPDTAEMAEAADAVMPEPEEAALPADDEALPPEPEAVMAAPEEPELPAEEMTPDVAETAEMAEAADAVMPGPEEAALPAEDEALPPEPEAVMAASEEPELPAEELAPDTAETAEMAEAADAVVPEPEEAALPTEDEALPPEPEAVMAAPEEPELPAEEMAPEAVVRAEANLLAGMEVPSAGVPLDAAREVPPDEEFGEEETFSLRTRSMAEVLAEQGDLQGALDIYYELAAAATSADEAEDINRRIATLSGRLNIANASAGAAVDAAAAARSKEQLLGMLQTLAERVEARAQG